MTMQWNADLYTVDYGDNQWMIARLLRADVSGYHLEDSRGNRTILPAHTVRKLTKREGW